MPFEPTWHDDERLREFAFEAVGEKLMTPMSIRQLIGYTKNVKDEEGLKEGIKKAAEDTKITFAREIKEIFNKGEYDKLVFLCFPYLSVDLEVAKSCYNEVLNDLRYDLIKAKDLYDLLEEFNEVEISLSLSANEYVRFIHPLYRDAFEYALVDKNKPNNISKKIFLNVVSKLSEKETFWGGVYVQPLIINCNLLPKDVWTELLFKLSERSKARWWVTWAAVWYFDKFPEDVWNKLLLKLSKKDQAIVGDTIEEVVFGYGLPIGDVKVKNLFDRLRKWFPFVIEYLLSKEGSKAEVTQNKIKAINLICSMSSPLIWKIDKIFICSSLGKLSKDDDVEVSRTAQAVMDTICEDLKGGKNVETG